MSICLYKLMMHLMPPEIDEIKGGKETVARLLKEMGKVSVDEMKLLVISIFLLIFWTTEKKLHPIDNDDGRRYLAAAAQDRRYELERRCS